MPDWRAVFELNYKGAPDFWGRDIDKVLTKAREWYVIVHEAEDGVLIADWEGAGFRVLQAFRWDEFVGNDRVTSFPTPV